MTELLDNIEKIGTRMSNDEPSLEITAEECHTTYRSAAKTDKILKLKVMNYNISKSLLNHHKVCKIEQKLCDKNI